MNMETVALAVIAAVVLLSPPILAIVAVFRFRTAGEKQSWMLVLPMCVLLDWLLLLAWTMAGAIGLGQRFLSTPIADVLLLLSLFLLIGAACSSFARWKLCAASLILLSFWVWTEQNRALSDNGSMLSVAVSRLADKVGLPPGSSSYMVLHKMSNYERRGHDDAAIAAGKAWTEAYPKDGSNDRVFVGIAWIFLKKAKQDIAHRDEHVHDALLYRDKALPIASDVKLGWYSIRTLRDLALISKAAGDLSPTQRCLQYENAMKLLERRAVMLNDKQDEITRRFVPDKDDLTIEDVKCLSDENQADIAGLRETQQSRACKQ